MWLRLPIGTDIRDPKAPAGADTCEVPRHSQRFYTVQWVDDIGFGFTNEHRFAIIQALGTWPTPFPNGQTGPLPPLPFPPILLGQGNTANVQAVSFNYTVNPTAAGNLWTIAHYSTPSLALKCNGQNVIVGSQQTYGTGAQGHVIAVFRFAVSAGSQTVTINCPAAQMRVMGAYSLWENYTSLSPDVSSQSIGTTGVPSQVPVSNPFAQPVKLLLFHAGFVNPPGGNAPAGGYSLIASDTTLVSPNAFSLQTSFNLPAATGPLPTASYTPTSVWTAWAVQVDEAT
jgi:hypothetical protein